MDEIKLKNFEAMYSGKALPKFHHLERLECESLRTVLATKLALPRGSDGLEILRVLGQRAEDIRGVRPSEESFSLAALFTQLQLEPKSIYINWSRFDDIDEMPLSVFSAAFHDLWYPSSDDIEIFDQGHKWVLLIRHFDVVQIVWS